MSNGPAAAAPAIFDELVDWIKQISPARTDDKPLGSGGLFTACARHPALAHQFMIGARRTWF